MATSCKSHGEALPNSTKRKLPRIPAGAVAPSTSATKLMSRTTTWRTTEGAVVTSPRPINLLILRNMKPHPLVRQGCSFRCSDDRRARSVVSMGPPTPICLPPTPAACPPIHVHERTEVEQSLSRVTSGRSRRRCVPWRGCCPASQKHRPEIDRSLMPFPQH